MNAEHEHDTDYQEIESGSANAASAPKKKKSWFGRVSNLIFLVVIVLMVGIALGYFSGVRESFRNAINDDLVGEKAPEVTSGDWVLPSGMSAPKDEGWRLIAFFKDH